MNDGNLQHPQSYGCEAVRHATSRSSAKLLLAAIVALCMGPTGDASAHEPQPNAQMQVGRNRVSVAVSKSSVQVAEPFQMTVRVEAPGGASVLFPPQTPQLGEFDVLNCVEAMDVPTAADADHRTWTRTCTLESIATGDMLIPSIMVQIQHSGESVQLESEPVSVHVQSVLEDRADPMRFRDIHSVIDVPIRQPRSIAWVWWSLVGAAGLALAAAGIVASARRSRWQTPQEWATQAIAALHKSMSQQPDPDRRILAAGELSSILRRYLAMQFEVSTPMRTSDELRSWLESSSWVSGDSAAGMNAVFSLADQVKFAGLVPDEPEMTRAMGDVQALVDEISQSTAVDGQRPEAVMTRVMRSER